jgi:UDP-N-acetylmuramate dehydrogenase
VKVDPRKSLKALNTFGVEAEAKYFTEVRSGEEFDELRADKRFGGEKKLILGGGSNILLTGDFDGWVVKNSIPGITVTSETDSEVIVRAGAGVSWQDLVTGCIEKNYGGLENLSLIPGLVGAAPIQNIGAYGAEQKDTFHELEAIEIRTGARVRFSSKDCAFGYRDSIFKHQFRGQFFITSVSFKLKKLSELGAFYRFRTEYGDLRRTLDEMKVQDLSLKAVSDAVCRIRRAKLPDPKELGNAGSFFKNPVVSEGQFKKLVSQHPQMPHYPQQDGTVKVPAGWLVEACGWKGKTVGRAGVHKTQALVLVNYNGATGREILELSEAIFISVKEKFGIELALEVNVV